MARSLPTVLVVDDDVDTCEMIRAVLESCGSIVETAHSADAGLTTYETWKPDVIICDIGMPEADGYEFIRRVLLHVVPDGFTLHPKLARQFEARAKVLVDGVGLELPLDVATYRLGPGARSVAQCSFASRRCQVKLRCRQKKICSCNARCGGHLP